MSKFNNEFRISNLDIQFFSPKKIVLARRNNGTVSLPLTFLFKKVRDLMPPECLRFIIKKLNKVPIGGLIGTNKCRK